MKLKLHKLTIVIFTVILCIFYLQIVSCKSNEDPPVTVYSNYTGTARKVSAFEPIEITHVRFTVENNDVYYIGLPSDIEKFNEYFGDLDLSLDEITIKATYSNNFQGKRNNYKDNFDNSRDRYLFDITIIK